ncbi:hypothetical protein DFH06DRAFT_1427081 [Mycena polygramma]|nr:hypothetical protein DFH06DRAFT_1427081 [Mycena polygramma]
MSSIDEFLSARQIYLQDTFVELFMNGKKFLLPNLRLYTGLFLVTLYAMVFKATTRKTGVLLALIAMYTLSTVHLACKWVLIKHAFIDHGDSPTSTVIHLVQSPLWLTVLPAVTLTTNTLVADCVLIWRCWIVWDQDWKVVLVPLLCTFVGAGLGFRSVAYQAAYITNPNGVEHSSLLFIVLGHNRWATILIIIRIVIVTDSTTRKSRGYGRVVEVLVESALLYSVTLAVFLPFLVRASVNDGYPQAVLVQMTGIAPTLIVARVSLGLARPDETWQNPTTSLAFARRSKSELPTTSGSSHSHAAVSLRFAGPSKSDSELPTRSSRSDVIHISS